MNIAPISLNFIKNNQNKRTLPQSYKTNELSCDTFSFTGKSKKAEYIDPLEKLVPKHKGIIYKKVCDENGNVIKKIPVEADIVAKNSGTFQFKMDDEEIGYVQLIYIPAESCNKNSWADLYNDYKEEGIVGDRIAVKYVYNGQQEKYGGIGHLADLIEVAACKKIGFEPNVVSFSAIDAAPLHYLRGKRFVPYEHYCSQDEMYEYNLEGKNPNDTIKEILENTPKGEKFDTSEIEMYLIMYMPKEQIKELEKELKDHPIF